MIFSEVYAETLYCSLVYLRYHDESKSFFYIYFDSNLSGHSCRFMILKEDFQNEIGDWSADQNRIVVSDERHFFSILSDFILIFTSLTV